MVQTPRLVAFDVLGTLFSVESLRVLLPPIGLARHDLELWWTRIVRDGCALSATGTFEPFNTVAAGALRDILASREITARDDYFDEALGGFNTLEPYPDVEATLSLLKDRGLRLVTLGNCGSDLAQGLLKRAGIAHYFESCMSIDEFRFWKPRPEVYVLCTRATGVEPGEAAMISCHSWDIHGAHEAGLRTGWARRLEKNLGRVFLPPDVVGDSLLEVAQGLLEMAPSYSSPEAGANF